MSTTKISRIPVLSVNEPWASAIIHGPKPVENRNWATQHRGPLLIHASLNQSQLKDRQIVDFVLEHWPSLADHLASGFPLGKIIGIVNVDGCRDIVKPVAPWEAGPVAWDLSHRTELPPFPARGKPGLFYLKPREIPGPARLVIEAWLAARYSDSRAASKKRKVADSPRGCSGPAVGGGSSSRDCSAA